MDCPQGDRAVVQAMRLGLEPERIAHMVTPITIEPETLIIRCSLPDPVPLLLCLHPSRLCEFQCARRLRDLEQLAVHLAFPRGLHAREVDLGGARTVGYGWYHYTGDNPAFRQSLADAAEYLDSVLARLQEQLDLDARRFYVIGIEDAAMLALLLALRQRPLAAAAAVIDGQLHPEVLSEFAAAADALPLLRMCHQRPAPQEAATPDAEALRGMGFAVDEEVVPPHDKNWEEEAGIMVSWFSQRAGLALVAGEAAGSTEAVTSTAAPGPGGESPA